MFRLVRRRLEGRRADLRHYRRVLKGAWVDDPSNDNPRFDRVRWRNALPDLETLGLDVPRLAETAQTMGRAAQALQARAADVAAQALRPLPLSGEVLMDRTILAQTEADTQLRLLARVLQWVSQSEYRPRIAPLEALLDRLLSGGGGTLHGCEARIHGDHIRVFREYAAVAEKTAQPGALWDGRFETRGKGGQFAALGHVGWTQIPTDQRSIPYHAARSLPAVFDGATLLACPALGHGQGFDATFTGRLPLFAQAFFDKSGSMRRRIGESD